MIIKTGFTTALFATLLLAAPTPGLQEDDDPVASRRPSAQESFGSYLDRMTARDREDQKRIQDLMNRIGNAASDSDREAAKAELNIILGKEKSIQRLLNKIKNATSDSDRDAAKAELKTTLGKDYDARLDSYEKYLDNLEKQLEKMRERLARRRNAKDEMLELRIKVLQAAADDLGWPTNLGSANQFR